MKNQAAPHSPVSNSDATPATAATTFPSGLNSAGIDTASSISEPSAPAPTSEALALEPRGPAPAAQQKGLSAAPGGLPAPLPVRVRAFDPSDLNLVLSAHLQSGRESSHSAPMLSQDYWAVEQEAFAYLANFARILVVCHADRLREVYGFVCFESGPDGSQVVHSIYVKQLFRRRGLARLLLESAGWRTGCRIWGTRWSQKAGRLASKFGARFKPHLLYSGPTGLRR